MTIEAWARGIVAALALYAAVGLAFAVAFVWKGVGRVDPGAREATWGFRLIVLPATVALWPLLLGRWRRAAAGEPSPPVETNAHRRAAAPEGRP